MTSEALETRERAEIALPTTGELYDLDDEVEATRFLQALGEYQRETLAPAKAHATQTMLTLGRRLGSKKFTVQDALGTPVADVEVVDTSEVEWVDVEQMEEKLRAAGLPEQKIREVIELVPVQRKVLTTKAKQIARANPAYDEIVVEHMRRVAKPPRVKVG